MLEIHEFAKAFPVMAQPDFELLKQSIKSSGVRQPAILWEGKIIDGRHRYQACVELGIECPTVNHEGDEDSALALVKDLNSTRRHLSPAQLAVAAAKLAAVFTARHGTSPVAVENPPVGGFVPDQRVTIASAASITGASKRSTERMTAVLNAAPEIAEQVAEGKLSVRNAEAMARRQVAPKVNMPTVPTDRLGIVIPDELASVFVDAETFGEIVTKLRQVKGDAKVFVDCEAGRNLHYQSFEAGVDELIRAVNNARPYTVTPPNCKLKKDGAVPRFLTKMQYENLPPEQRHAVEPVKA